MINLKIRWKILIVIISAIINFLLAYAVLSLKICFIFLDSIGTIASAIILGPIYGSIVGLISNIILSMTLDYSNIHFAVVNAIIGLIVGFTANKYGFRIKIALFVGLIIAIISSSVSIPILIILSQGEIDKTFDLTIRYFISKGMKLEPAIIIGTLLSSIIDKVFSCLIVSLIFSRKIYNNSIIKNYEIVGNVFNEKMKYNFIIVFIGIIANIVFTYAILILKIPFLFMDSIGTILTGVIIGPIPAALVGITTNIIFSFTIDYLNIHFAIVNAMIGLIAGIISRKYGFNMKIALASGLIIGIISGIISIPISIILTNGVTTGTIDVLMQSFINSGANLLVSTSIITLSAAIFDKILSCLFVCIAVKKIYFFKINI